MNPTFSEETQELIPQTKKGAAPHLLGLDVWAGPAASSDSREDGGQLGRSFPSVALSPSPILSDARRGRWEWFPGVQAGVLSSTY